jgi:hypothetical protein
MIAASPAASPATAPGGEDLPQAVERNPPRTGRRLRLIEDPVLSLVLTDEDEYVERKASRHWEREKSHQRFSFFSACAVGRWPCCWAIPLWRRRPAGHNRVVALFEPRPE